MLTKMIVDAIINKLITIFSFLKTNGCKVFQNETDVKDAPTTEVIAAIQITMPKKRYEKMGSPRVGERLSIEIKKAEH